MQKLLLPLLFLLVACSPALSNSGATEAVIEPLVVRPDGAFGETVVYDVVTEERTVVLEEGRISADHQTHFTANATDRTTKITRYNARSGQEIDTTYYKGRWELAGLSPNGEWLALSHPREGESVIQIIDTATNEVADELWLKGTFEVEAVSNAGTSLYLIEHLADDDKYRVRLYDLAANELQEEALRDKRIQDEFMTGYAWGTVQDPTGEWLLTLYVNTARNAAFIHALNLDNSITFCLDLPSDKADFATLQQYTMTLSHDKQTIYAANPALGVLSEIPLGDLNESPQITRFAGSGVGEDVRQTSVLSANNHHLFFAQNSTVWHYDTQAQAVTMTYEADAQIDGLALIDDTLFVAQHDGKLHAIAHATTQYVTMDE